MNEVTIRNATLDDAERILYIYSHYVENTAVTCEVATPTLDDFKWRMEHKMEHYPYLVAEVDGVIRGYTYAGAFIDRAAYDWSCETTIYTDIHAQRCGIGRKLYEALWERLGEMGIINLYARIVCPDAEDEYLTFNSKDFHEHLGYRQVGKFTHCANKFGRWYNALIMEKIIGEHVPNPKKVF